MHCPRSKFHHQLHQQRSCKIALLQKQQLLLHSLNFLRPRHPRLQTNLQDAVQPNQQVMACSNR